LGGWQRSCCQARPVRLAGKRTYGAVGEDPADRKGIVCWHQSNKPPPFGSRKESCKKCACGGFRIAWKNVGLALELKRPILGQ